MSPQPEISLTPSDKLSPLVEALHAGGLTPSQEVALGGIIRVIKEMDAQHANTLAQKEDDIRTILTLKEKVIQDLRHELEHDNLTGLLNLRGFARFGEALTDIINATPEDQKGLGFPRAFDRIAIAFCDLNGFKGVNDTYGHEVGDELLKIFGATLSGVFRNGDFVARRSGDEFIVALPVSSEGFADNEDLRNEVYAAAQDKVEGTLEVIQDYLRDHPETDPTTVRYIKALGTSIGMSVYDPREGKTISEIIDEADHDMLKHKKAKGRRG
jgi:diguanylate cyclase (GGDEF)-like protein